jgi:hypothetical protein
MDGPIDNRTREVVSALGRALAVTGSRLTERPANPRASARRNPVLQAVLAIVASGLFGITIGRAMELDAGPTSVTRSGLTVRLPLGWEEGTSDPGRPAISPAIAAVPSEGRSAGLVAGKLSSHAAAVQMLEGVQHADDGRTQVRLGGVQAWRYAGLRQPPGQLGTGYLVPTLGGAVLVICHASKDEARLRLAECDRAATTLVVHGVQPRRLSSVDRSRERLIRVIATFRDSRSRGRRRLAAAERAAGQAEAATSLRRNHERAARSVERISPLEDGRSLGNLSAALRAAAAAYGRLARAATTSSSAAYTQASHAVVREDEAVRRELTRASGA